MSSLQLFDTSFSSSNGLLCLVLEELHVVEHLGPFGFDLINTLLVQADGLPTSILELVNLMDEIVSSGLGFLFKPLQRGLETVDLSVLELELRFESFFAFSALLLCRLLLDATFHVGDELFTGLELILQALLTAFGFRLVSLVIVCTLVELLLCFCQLFFELLLAFLNLLSATNFIVAFNSTLLLHLGPPVSCLSSHFGSFSLENGLVKSCLGHSCFSGLLSSTKLRILLFQLLQLHSKLVEFRHLLFVERQWHDSLSDRVVSQVVECCAVVETRTTFCATLCS